MNTKHAAVVLAAGLLATTAFGKSVVLKIDYNGKQQCSYSIEYTSRGDYRQKGTTTKKTTGVNCFATASFADQNRLNVKVDTVVIKSDIYKDSKIKEIRESIMKSSYALNIANGYPAIDTTAKMPATEYLEWDLYRQLIKLLPILPDKSIKPGFTWEQSMVVPMQTARGTIPCELFRFYTFKKLRGDTATVVWNFRYAPSDNAVDSTNALEDIPIGGNGSGSALIDVRNKYLISADMGFSTPVAVINDIKVTWRERAVFALKHCK
jgi:hypothetical protein